MPRKRREAPRSYEFDPEVKREIERQTQKQQEIDNKRTKQRLIFWLLIIFGTAMAVGVAVVLSDLAEW